MATKTSFYEGATTVFSNTNPAVTYAADGTVITPVRVFIPVTSKFLTGMDGTGLLSAAQPAASDVSGLAASATTDTTVATNITSGTLPAAQLPVPTNSTLGGVKSLAAVANNFLTSISTAGAPTQARPAAADVSGLGTAATLNVGTSASQIVQLNGSSQIPAVDGSLLTGLPSATVKSPQGRLTLATVTPVMTATQSAKTTIYYTPYVGQLVPIYNGTKYTMTDTGGELSVATTDTAKSPAAIGVSKCNDWFVWSDAGTMRVGHGPDWTSDTARSASSIIRINGLWLNDTTITNGPAAQRGTYVGTTRSNASSQLDFIYGTSAASGGAGFIGIWNAYNRVLTASRVQDSTASWTYGSTAVQNSHASATNRVSFVRGLAEDPVSASYSVPCIPGTSSDASAGIWDGTTVLAGTYTSVVAGSTMLSTTTGPTPAVGFSYLSAAEWLPTNVNVATFSGTVGSKPVMNFTVTASY
jgi:hypothetical protein